MSFLAAYRLALDVLSPIHVGTGEAFPAYSYLIDEARQEAAILDAGRLLELLGPEQQRLYLQAVAQGPKRAQESLQSLYRQGAIDPTPATVRRVAVSPAFVQTVKAATDVAGLEFRPLPQSSRGAYLPGSSIKGALRTAWLFARVTAEGRDIAYQKDVWSWEGQAPSGDWPLIRPPRHHISPYIAQRFEGLVLDYAITTPQGRQQLNLHRDPFRQVRVGDSDASDAVQLDRIAVFTPKGTMEGTVLLAETFRTKTQLLATVRVHVGLAQQKHGHTVSHAITAQGLAEACREYYLEVAAREQQYAVEHRLERAEQLYDALERRLEADRQAFPMRIGFGSGRMAIRLALLLDSSEGDDPRARKTVGATRPKDGLPLGWAVARLEPV
jgi:CRISPR-associated protein Csm5